MPPFAKPLHGYGFFEILSSKNSDTLIRILYFRYENKMVLLHAFEKPAYYHATWVKKKIIKQNKLAQEYLKIFKLNPDNYEKYE